MLRTLRTTALLRAQCKNYAATASYASIPQPQTSPDVLYTGVSTLIQCIIIYDYLNKSVIKPLKTHICMYKCTI